MIYRIQKAVMLSLLLAVVMVIPVLAGGWAVITLDELPADVHAGEPVSIGFTVLQHGRTPMSDLATTITMVSPAGETSVVYPKPEGRPGHYTVSLTFPTAGEWQWSIQAFTMDQLMPALAVRSSTLGTQPVDESVEGSPPVVWIVRVLAFGLGAIGLAIAFRRQNRFVGALTAICLVVGIGSFVTGSAVPAADAQSPAVPGSPPPSQVELGQQLFVAKGCITCHFNDRVANNRDYWTIDNGAPDLTEFSASPEILHIRLKNPADAKSDTQMPNLGLSDTEIEALIAFINSN